MSSPPGSVWPSAGAGANTTTQGSGNSIPEANGYEYGINITSGGPVTIDHCDMWGFANAIVLYSTTAQINITNNWIHDAGDASEGAHQDGIGFLNGGIQNAPSNVLIQGNTIVSLGNTNALAWQGQSGGFTGWDNIQQIVNYIGGFGYILYPGGSYTITNWIFTDNVFATDVQWVNGPIREQVFGGATEVTHFSNNGCLWRRNKLLVVSGTTPSGTSAISFNSGNNGQFVLPNSTSQGFSATDFTG